MPDLAPRDARLLDLAASGLTDKAIAREVGLSPFTVHDRIKRLLKLLGAKNRTEAVAVTAEARAAQRVALACAELCESRTAHLTNTAAQTAKAMGAAIRAKYDLPSAARQGATHGNDAPD